MSADKVVSKDPTKWTLNLLKDNCYERTESGSIADVRERYLLLKASLFVGIIDFIYPHRSCLHSQSFGASTSRAWESCGIVAWPISQLVHDQHFLNISFTTRGLWRSFSSWWMKFVVSKPTEVRSVFCAHNMYIFLDTIAINGKSTKFFKALAATDSKSQSQTLSTWAWLTRLRLLQRMLSFSSN